jgi:hypothetical protein
MFYFAIYSSGIKFEFEHTKLQKILKLINFNLLALPAFVHKGRSY